MATIDEVEHVFGRLSKRREVLIHGLKGAIKEFKKVGVKCIFIDGSFTTNKVEPLNL